MTGLRRTGRARPRSLRARAEERLGNGRKGAEPRTEAEVRRLAHELQVHEIELEIQNAELARSRALLEVALEKYTDLYDFAPVGYFTLDRIGEIRSVNLAGADLLGVARDSLPGRRFGSFVSPGSLPAFNAFLERTFVGRTRRSCEVTLVPHVGRPRVVRMEASASPSREECRVVALDVTKPRSPRRKAD